MKRKIFIISVLVGMVYAIQAQTVTWELPPSDYTSIVRLGPNLFKAERYGKIGLIHADGSLLAAVDNDDISGLYEHKALVTRNDGQGERVVGCLTDDFKYFGYYAHYYTLNGQKFFSDGLLSVSDENGNVGFIDIQGKKVLGFDGKYNRIKPFTEGYAAVQKGKHYVLIDKDGEEVKFLYGGSGVGPAIGGCTNSYHGVAYVYDVYGGADRSYYTYNTKEKSRLRKVSKIKNTSKDYLFCYQSVTGRPKEVPLEPFKPKPGSLGLAPSRTSDGYGYVSGGYVIAPSQFSSASQFEDGLAIVQINGRTGILRFVDGAGFDINVPNVKYDFYGGNVVSCSFDLSVPSIWQGRQLDVKMKDSQGFVTLTSLNANKYTFTVSPLNSGQKEYTIEVASEGLKLFETVATYSFVKKERCLKCGKDKDQCEFHGNHPESPKPKVCETCGKKLSECKYQGVH